MNEAFLVLGVLGISGGFTFAMAAIAAIAVKGSSRSPKH